MPLLIFFFFLALGLEGLFRCNAGSEGEPEAASGSGGVQSGAAVASGSHSPSSALIQLASWCVPVISHHDKACCSSGLAPGGLRRSILSRYLHVATASGPVRRHRAIIGAPTTKSSLSQPEFGLAVFSFDLNHYFPLLICWPCMAISWVKIPGGGVDNTYT